VILLELDARLGHHDLAHLADAHLERAAKLGFDWIWLMGVWKTSPASVAISRTLQPDFEGSPYAIFAYEVSPELGGEPALRAFVERAHARGLQVMVDFVGNHVARDAPLLDQHPEFAVHWKPTVRNAHPADYFDHPKGRLAHGKDPYFPGWTDTAQLDYAHPALRAHQIEELKKIAGLVDGVRCDMAMLLLRDHVRQHWFPKVGKAAFDAAYPEEFWSEAIRAVRAVHPDFTFMAEVYWDREPRLQWLGFDYTYDKKLYDLFAQRRHVDEITGYLVNANEEYLHRCVHFVENHDEERAAVRFGRRARPAALLSYAVPGAVFVHQGQMEGKTERIPVQRREPLTREEPDAELGAFYARLLSLVKDPLFREGEVDVQAPQQGTVLLLRRYEERVALVGADPTAASPESPALDFALDRLGIAATAAVRCTDLWTGAVVPVATVDGRLRLPAGAVKSFADTHGLLLELGW
jgi:glycosidase